MPVLGIRERLKKIDFRSLTFFVLGVVVGVGIGAAMVVNIRTARSGHQVRQKGQGYTNPLLECETGGDTIGGMELRPFKHKVEELIAERISARKAAMASVYFRDLNNGPWLGINEDEKFYPASLLKVPVMMSVLKQSEYDRGLLRKKIEYKGGEDLNSNSYFKPSAHIVAGKKYTIEELLKFMVEYSDNNTIALLTANVKPELIHRIFHDLGVEYPVDRPEDYMSVRSYASFFRILFNASYLDREMSEKALSLLAAEDFPFGLRAGVPAGIPVANKFGEQKLRDLYQLHDCGIVYYPESPYLLCVMTRGSDMENLKDFIRDISHLVFSEIDAQTKAGSLSSGR